MATQPISTSVVLDNDAPQHLVDWPAIFAGVAVASGISIVMFTFGAAIGLSMVSPYDGDGVSRELYFSALGLWTLWVVLSSLAAGGYVAGRLRKPMGDATEHEVEVRDGAHGLVVWGVSIVVAAVLVALGVAGVAGATVSATRGALIDGGRSDAVAYTIDALFRAPKQPTPAAVTDADRREVARILTLGTVRGDLNATDQTYIADLIAARTGLNETEAQGRVTEVLAEAQSKADAARKLGVVLGFFTAAALVVGAAAAAWTATLGGRHRDRGIDASDFWRWR